MSKTSNEVKARWNRKTYNVYHLNLRKDRDREMIKFMERMMDEGFSAGDVIRQGLDLLMKRENRT